MSRDVVVIRDDAVVQGWRRVRFAFCAMLVLHVFSDGWFRGSAGTSHLALLVILVAVRVGFFFAVALRSYKKLLAHGFFGLLLWSVVGDELLLTIEYMIAADTIPFISATMRDVVHLTFTLRAITTGLGLALGWFVARYWYGPVRIQNGHTCPACGYSLLGANSGTCSECGWKIDLDRLGTTTERFSRAQRMWGRRPIREITASGSVASSEG